MVAKLVLPREFLDECARAPQVLAAMKAKCERILPRAQRLALAAGLTDFADGLHIETGVRPGTKSPEGVRRPFARVIAGSEDAEAVEYGDTTTAKQAILRRAMTA